MKIKRNKKGFTIIELVIVVAVIGVLAAVLIPTFINLTAKANETSDDFLVKSLNDIMSVKEQEPGYETTTYQKVIDTVDEAGYKIPNLVSRSGEDLFWNQESNRFYLGSKLDNQYPKYTYWTIKDALDGTEEYSVYAGLNFRATSAKNLKAGFDVGFNAHIKEVDYVGAASQQKGVRFRFLNEEYNADFKNNNNNEDEVKVYGNANSVNSEKSGQHSLYIYEDIASLEVKEGHVVVAPGVKIGSLIFKATSENTFDKIVVEIPDVNSQVDTIFRSGVSTNLEPGTKVEVATIKTTQKSETYFLSGNGTIEDSKLLVSPTGRVEDAAPVTEITASDAAKAIANAKDPDTGDVIDTGKTDDEIETVKEETQTEKQSEAAERKAEEAGEDFSKYEARIGLKGYNTLNGAIESAKENETVVLLKDLEMTGRSSSGAEIAISKSMTLNGDGHTITSDAGRTIWIDSSNVNVTIKNLTTVNSRTASTGYPRGFQINSNMRNVYLNIENCDVTTKYYALNICAGTTVDINIKNSTFTGWAAMNIWSNGVSIKATDSKFVGGSISNETFGAIVLEGDSTGITPMHSSDMVIDLENCELVATGFYSQTAIQFNNSSTGGAINNIVNLVNCDITCDTPIGQAGEGIPAYLVAYDAGTNNNINFDELTRFNGTTNYGLEYIWSNRGIVAYEISE